MTRGERVFLGTVDSSKGSSLRELAVTVCARRSVGPIHARCRHIVGVVLHLGASSKRPGNEPLNAGFQRAAVDGAFKLRRGKSDTEEPDPARAGWSGRDQPELYAAAVLESQPEGLHFHAERGVLPEPLNRARLSGSNCIPLHCVVLDGV